jgi:hypothetical protein
MREIILVAESEKRFDLSQVSFNLDIRKINGNEAHEASCPTKRTI